MTFNVSDLSNYQKEVLREIGNIGSGHAATSLSKMLNCRVDMEVPKVRILTFDEATDLMGSADNIVVAVHVEVYGDIRGFFLYIVEYESAGGLLKILMNSKESIEGELDELSISAIRETGNILTSSYIAAISTMTELDMRASVAEVVIDMLGAIISVPAIEYAQYGDSMLYIEADFISGKEKIGGRLILVPEVSSYERLLTVLGVADK